MNVKKLKVNLKKYVCVYKRKSMRRRRSDTLPLLLYIWVVCDVQECGFASLNKRYDLRTTRLMSWEGERDVRRAGCALAICFSLCLADAALIDSIPLLCFFK